MKRTMMQMYVRGSADAVNCYRDAFRADVGPDWRNEDGSCAHTELNAGGQILAVSEAPEGLIIGNGMQFCLQMDRDEEVKHAYAVLMEKSQMIAPLGECPYSQCMFALIDRFGVHWCIWS